MDEMTKTLVQELRASGTDLGKVITYCERRRPPTVYLTKAAVAAWGVRAPAAWAATRQWLDGRRIDVQVV